MKQEKINVLVKEPGKAPYMAELENSLHALQEAVGGYIETYTFAADATIVCNEEGKLMGLPYNCHLLGECFVGTILIAGVDGDEFCDLPVGWQEIAPKNLAV